MLIWGLRLFFTGVLLTMLYSTISAGFQENMFAISPSVVGDPWFVATLADAYCGFLTYFLWVCYRSPKWPSRVLWFVLIVCLGNMAMALYALLILWRLPSSATARDVLLRPEFRS